MYLKVKHLLQYAEKYHLYAIVTIGRTIKIFAFLWDFDFFLALIQNKRACTFDPGDKTKNLTKK